jgi:hypothetical protein
MVFLLAVIVVKGYRYYIIRALVIIYVLSINDIMS